MRGMSAREYFPWLEQEMLAALDRENLRRFGVKSNLTLPLSVGGSSTVRALGFNTTRAERTWPDAVAKRLQLVAHVFGNALARKRADETLRESEERLTLAADSAEAGLWTLDYSTGVFWATDRAPDRAHEWVGVPLLKPGTPHARRRGRGARGGAFCPPQTTSMS